MISRRFFLIVCAAGLLLGGLLVWSWQKPRGPELTQADRRDLERRTAALEQAGKDHYATAQTLLHDPIPAGDSLARLARFDSTVRSW